MAELTKQDDYIKTALRLPRDIHARVQSSAIADGRSMNAEIIMRLAESLNFPHKEVELLHRDYLEIASSLESCRSELSQTKQELEHAKKAAKASATPPDELAQRVDELERLAYVLSKGFISGWGQARMIMDPSKPLPPDALETIREVETMIREMAQLPPKPSAE